MTASSGFFTLLARMIAMITPKVAVDEQKKTMDTGTYLSRLEYVVEYHITKVWRNWR
jgi:hypothetical protein